MMKYHKTIQTLARSTSFTILALCCVFLMGCGTGSNPVKAGLSSTMATFPYNPSNNQITLGWTANTESDLAGYRIYYGTASGVYTANIDVGNVTQYTITGGFLPNTTYYFALTAYNSSAQESTFSSEFSYVPYFTLLYGGSAATAFTKHRTYAVSGGLVFAGTVAKHLKHVPSAGGPLNFQGSGTYQFHSGGLHVYTASGGLQFVGAAAPSKKIVRSASGGFAFAGAAATHLSSIRTIYSYTPVGGMSFGGTAAPIVTKHVKTASGGMGFTGAASSSFKSVVLVTHSFNYVPSGGGLAFGGTPTVVRVIVRNMSGGFVFGGSASTIKRSFALGSTIYNPSIGGELTFGGSASIITTKTYPGVGGMVFGGAAEVTSSLDQFGNEQRFRIFKRDCEVRIKEFGSDKAYANANPFGGAHHEEPSGAAI